MTTRSKPHRVLEHGTTIYKPTARESRWRVVTVDTTGRRSSRPAPNEAEALALAKLWERYNASRTPIPQRRTKARVALVEIAAARPSVAVSARLRDHADAWLATMAPVRAPGGWLGWSANHHQNVASSFRTHLLEVEIRGSRRWGDLFPEEWTALDSRLLLHTAAFQVGRSALTRLRAHLSSFQGYLHEAGALPAGVTPASRIPLPRVLGAESADDDSRPIVRDALPSMVQCEKLFAVADEYDRHDLAVALKLKHFAGPRFSELMALRPRDVDVDDLTVHVVRVWDPSLRAFLPTKNRKRRDTFFPASFADELGAWVDLARSERGDDGLLFPNSRGNVLAYGTFHDQWLRFATAAGWPMDEEARWAPTPSGHHVFRGRCRWTGHDLRHVAACWMLFDLKMDPGDVSLALGHATVEFTLRVYAGARGDSTDALAKMRAWR